MDWARGRDRQASAKDGGTGGHGSETSRREGEGLVGASLREHGREGDQRAREGWTGQWWVREGDRLVGARERDQQARDCGTGRRA